MRRRLVLEIGRPPPWRSCRHRAPSVSFATQAQGFAAPLSLTFTLAPPSCFYPRHANAILWLKCMVYLCKLAPVKAKLGGEGEVLGVMRTVCWWLFPVHPIPKDACGKEAGRKQANRFVCGTLCGSSRSTSCTTSVPELAFCGMTL